jgi:anti-anti-sigma factor
VGDQQTRSHGGGPLVVAMPQRVDIGNARTVGDDLQAAFDSGATVVIADLTSTLSCTAAGVHELALASERAAARSIDLRLAIPQGEALRVFALTGHDRWLPIYPDVPSALAGPASRGGSHQSAPLAPAGNGGSAA